MLMHSLISPKQKKMGAGIKIVGEQDYTDRQSRVGKEQKPGTSASLSGTQHVGRGGWRVSPMPIAGRRGIGRKHIHVAAATEEAVGNKEGQCVAHFWLLYPAPILIGNHFVGCVR